MQTLTEITNKYINESVTQFALFTNDIDVVRKNCNGLLYIRKLHGSVLTEFEEKLNNISQRANSQKVFIYPTKGSKFKIPYEFNDLVLQEFNNSTNFTVSQNSGTRKIKVYYKNNILFETGEGSIGNITTHEQESSTCIIWNNYVENKNIITNNIVDIIKHVSEYFSKNDKWVNSFKLQILTIKHILTNEFNVDYTKYRMCMYGSSEYCEHEIGKLYESLIKQYAKQYEGNKNHYDPSDVLIYNQNEQSKIISILKELNDNLKNNLSGEQVKKRFFELLFDKRLLMGISLKQITGRAKYDLYNVRENNSKITNINKVEQITSDNKTNILSFAVYGKFNFDNICDNKGYNVDNSNCLYITMRTFGNGQTGVDCTMYGISDKAMPSLGKCSVRIWRDKILEVGSSLSITEYINAFKEKINLLEDKDIFNIFREIIMSAIKEGPACFPFILIH